MVQLSTTSKHYSDVCRGNNSKSKIKNNFQSTITLTEIFID